MWRVDSILMKAGHRCDFVPSDASCNAAMVRIPAGTRPYPFCKPLNRLRAIAPADCHARCLAGLNFVLRWIRRSGIDRLVRKEQ